MKARYGTKTYAEKTLRRELREYAKAQRERAANPSETRRIREFEKHGMFLGAWSALCDVGALNDAQRARWMQRKKRVDSAKVTRRPFGELRRAA